MASEDLAAATPLLAAGAPALGILSALDGDASRLISRCVHDAPHTRTHAEGSMLGPGAAARKSRDFDGGWARGSFVVSRGRCSDSDGRFGSEKDQRARCALFRATFTSDLASVWDAGRGQPGAELFATQYVRWAIYVEVSMRWPSMATCAASVCAWRSRYLSLLLRVVVLAAFCSGLWRPSMPVDSLDVTSHTVVC